MSKRIFIDGNIDSELCIIATDGQEINYFDYSDELAKKKTIFTLECLQSRTLFKQLY